MRIAGAGSSSCLGHRRGVGESDEGNGECWRGINSCSAEDTKNTESYVTSSSVVDLVNDAQGIVNTISGVKPGVVH